MEMKKAKRVQAKVKLAIAGISGSGKTMSSLLMAYGMVKELHPGMSDEEAWEKICLIDTENSSGSLYSNAKVKGTTTTIGEYFTIDIHPPFTVDKYIEAIKTAEENGIEVLIIDSVSHAWAGEGGALDKQAAIAANSPSGNSYTAWRQPKKDQGQLMNTILQCKMHVISCIRAKTEYVQDKDDKGKTHVRKVGLGLITQGETDYEYTTVFMLNQEHIASSTKDRTGRFDGQYFVITPDTGREVIRWLGDAPMPEEPKPEINKTETPAEGPVDPARVEAAKGSIGDVVAKLMEAGKTKTEIAAVIKENCGVANYLKVDDITKLTATYRALADMQ